MYEVSIEPRTTGGSKLAGEVEVRVDAPVTVVRSDGGVQRLEAWKPGVPAKVMVSEGGRARVRVLAAKSLDCPALRLRAAGMDADCWTVVRPADGAQRQLASLSATALKQPPPGKTPVLKSSMPKDDAEAVAQFMRDTARALPTAATLPIKKGQKLSWGNVLGHDRGRRRGRRQRGHRLRRRRGEADDRGRRRRGQAGQQGRRGGGADR
ncbi:hypothetical protein [Nannocystis pusilla]|uniref:hypothetical protein n=1 Tax=Nannocystis pusilla TaxID=889268 RepID=UPI003DA254A3